MSSKTYIHYGADAFSMEKFEEKKSLNKDNRHLNKPNYGLWASPLDADFGWKDWCEAEEFHTDRLNKSFTFTLSDTARILTVTKKSDFADYVNMYDWIPLFKSLDFNTIMKKYDGLELIHGENYCELHYGLFNSWDVDSIVIWNPEVIIFQHGEDCGVFDKET